MPRKRRREVWIAKIGRRQSTLFDTTFADDLIKALDPDLPVERYRRVWRLSRPLVEGKVLAGKLGFDRPARTEQVHYDEDAKDFVVEASAAEQGNFAYYVIDLPSQLIAFELRPPDIYLQSFLGALEKILAMSPARFEVDLLSDEKSFQDWLDDVDTITRFYATRNPPNPSSTRRAREIRQIIDETNADRVSLEATADRDSAGLTVSDTLLADTADHAAAGNGFFKVTGLKRGARRFYNSLSQRLIGQIEVSEEDDETSVLAKIRRVLKDLTKDRMERHD